MSFETDFDSAFTILLGKAVEAIPSAVIAPTTGGTSTTTTAGISTGIEYVIDGGGNAISNGSKGGLIVPFPFTITKVELQEFDGLSGSITVDIQAGVPGNGPTFASICGSAVPSITGSRHYSDSTLSGWTTDIDRGDALKYVVSGSATIQRLLVMLFVRRTDI